MSMLEPGVSLAAFRESLRNVARSFRLHAYEATPEDYEQVADEDLKCEYVDGELIVHSPASLEHEELTGFVFALLREFITSRSLGRAYGSNAVMQLGERRFSPDASVLLNEHADRVRGGRVHGPLDLVVEVISTSTRDYDFRTKLPAYREGRVGEIWLIDGRRRQFEVHALRAGNYDAHTLATGNWTSVALHGFRLQVDWLWSDPLPAIGDCRIE